MHWEKSILVIAILFGLCYGHGYLSRPASRNNMRLIMNSNQYTECPYGEKGCTIPEIDYDKQSRAAGGPGLVHATCKFGDNCDEFYGMCGNAYNGPQDHMEGGKFSSGRVNGIYAPGQVIYLDLVITAHHNGYHEFTLYDVDDDATATTVLTRDVKSYKLKVNQPQIRHNRCKYWGVDPKTQWCMPEPTGPTIRDPPYLYTSAWVLPAGVTCKRCVLQWHWVTANSPGAQPEEFWGCADITIRSQGRLFNEKQENAVSIGAGFASGDEPLATLPPPPPSATIPKDTNCVAVKGSGASDDWCQTVKCDQTYINGGFCKKIDGATTAPTTSAPVTSAPVTSAPATEAPVTSAPATEAPVTSAPATPAPTTKAPATEAPATPAPTTKAPATKAPVTSAPDVPVTPTRPSSPVKCKGVPSKGTTDLWCQQTDCAEVYVKDGYCVKTA